MLIVLINIAIIVVVGAILFYVIESMSATSGSPAS